MPSDGAARELADGKLLIDEPLAQVVRLTISNPSKRNALDHPILDAITATLTELQATATRCLIVTGGHGMFSAGYDIGEVGDDDFERRAERLVARPFTAAIDALEAFACPTLAVLGGPTIGGGLELALACDLRVAQDDIRLGMPPARLGLVYSHTGLRRFLQTIGAARTRELFLLAEQIDAPTALAWGWSTASPRPRSWTRSRSSWPGRSRPTRRCPSAGTSASSPPCCKPEGALSPATENELTELRLASFASEDIREGMRAFVEKRPARWRGR